MRSSFPAAERNKVHIASTLMPYLAEYSALRLLELASGDGTHITHIADQVISANSIFQPTELNVELVRLIDLNAASFPSVKSAAVFDLRKHKSITELESAMASVAEGGSLKIEQIHNMPANNKTIVWS